MDLTRSFKKRGFIIGDKLGGGSYGEVYTIEYEGNILAIKIPRTYDYAELDVSSRIDNNYVIYNNGLLLPTLHDVDNIGILLPLVEETSRQIGKPSTAGNMRSFNEQVSFLRKIIEGVHCLHANGVLHLDLKPDNVLSQLVTRTVTRNRPGRTPRTSTHQIKEPIVADFGLSLAVRNVVEGEYFKRTLGTVNHRAPEHFYYRYENREDMKLRRDGKKDVMTRREESDGSPREAFFYRASSDIWAIGCIALYLFTRQTVFPQDIINKHYPHDKVYYHMYDNYRTPELMDTYLRGRIYGSGYIDKESKEMAIDFLKRCLDFNPDNRLGTNELLSHDIFKIVLTPIKTCGIRSSSWNIEKRNKSVYFSIKSVVAFLINFMVKMRLNRFAISVLFHAVDLVYRHYVILSNSMPQDQRTYHSVTLGMIWIALSYHNYAPEPMNFFELYLKYIEIEKKDLANNPNIVQSPNEFLNQADTFIHNARGVIYRRFIYDSCRTTSELRNLYKKLLIDPEKYYTFVPVDTQPLVRPVPVSEEESLVGTSTANFFGVK